MGVARITKTFWFEAAHVLPWHTGKCSRMHGHSYRLDVTVSGGLDERGVVMDFSDLADAVNEAVLVRLDHTVLNDLVDNPTAERVALHVLGLLTEAGLPVDEVVLWETRTSRVSVGA